MPKPTVTPMAACLCAALALPATMRAQSLVHASREQSLSLATTFTAGDRVDASASPLPYGGTGFGGAASYQSSVGQFLFSVTADGSRSFYVPRTGAPTSARESAFASRLETSLVRQSATVVGGRVGLGLAVLSSAELLEHQYADVTSTRAAYITAFGLVGPLTTWTRDAAGGRARLSLDVPVAGVVYQPYGDARVEREGPRLRGVTPSQLRAADAALRYDFAVRGAAGLFSEYRLRGFALKNVEPIRSLSHSLTVGIVERFGAQRDR